MNGIQLAELTVSLTIAAMQNGLLKSADDVCNFYEKLHDEIKKMAQADNARETGLRDNPYNVG